MCFYKFGLLTIKLILLNICNYRILANAVLMYALCTSLPVYWDLSTFIVSFYSFSYPRILMLFTETKFLGIRCLPFHQGRKRGPLGAILQDLDSSPVILLIALVVNSSIWFYFPMPKWTLNINVRFINAHQQNIRNVTFFPLSNSG